MLLRYGAHFSSLALLYWITLFPFGQRVSNAVGTERAGLSQTPQLPLHCPLHCLRGSASRPPAHSSEAEVSHEGCLTPEVPQAGQKQRPTPDWCEPDLRALCRSHTTLCLIARSLPLQVSLPETSSLSALPVMTHYSQQPVIHPSSPSTIPPRSDWMLLPCISMTTTPACLILVLLEGPQQPADTDVGHDRACPLVLTPSVSPGH